MAPCERPEKKPAFLKMGLSIALFEADFFRALAHPIRIRILEELGTGERSFQELQQALKLEQPIVSQQLAILRGKNIVPSRKLGTALRYALSDPLLIKLLSVAQEIYNNHLIDTVEMTKNAAPTIDTPGLSSRER
jgi:ArsR family transcriptional regulator